MAADIHALELEFAKNPTLEACIPLCEAYLSHKRFMEAMVVCKKGIKNAPKDPRGRVLLARVYLKQGKLPKAEQELKGTLQAFPGNPNAAALMGELLVQQGRNQEAVAFLQQALTADANLESARNLLMQLGAPIAQQQAVPQLATQGAAPVQAPAMQAPTPVASGSMAQPPTMPIRPSPQGGVIPPAIPPGLAPQPASNPWATGTDPNLALSQPIVGHSVTGMPQPDAAGGAPPQTGPKLEHVSDFFADETLGFQSDGSHIETAGPGRLTILGFVPKSTGSIKTTIVVAIALFAIVSVIVTSQWISSENTRKIAKLYSEVREAMDEDKYVRYQDALRTAQEILKVDDAHNQTLAAMAYAEAILGNDHLEDGAIDRSQAYLQRALETGEDDTEYRVAASLLLAYHAHDYDRGVAECKRIQDMGGTAALIEVECFRVMNRAKPGDRETARQLQRVINSLTFHARGFTMLGWYYYRLEDWTKADRWFDEALKNSKNHPVAMLGQALTDLDRNIGIKERQKEISEKIKKVHSLPRDELSPPVKALAHFVRAQLYQWQGKTSEAEKDYDQAFRLDPGNTMFHVARGRALMILNRWSDAIAEFREASKADPNNPAIYKKLCKAQTKTGDSRGAAASCARAKELTGSRDYEAVFLDCERQRESNKLEEAIGCYLGIPLEAGASIYSQARIAVGRVYQAQRQWNKAAVHLTEFLEKAPGGIQPPLVAEAWCELGQAYEGAGQKTKAMECYTYGIEQYPYHAPCHYFTCKSSVFGRRDPEKSEACKRYLTVAPRGEHVREVERILGKLPKRNR